MSQDWEGAEGGLGSQQGLTPSRLSAWTASTWPAARLQPGRSMWSYCRHFSSSSWNGCCWNSATRHTVSNILCNKYLKKKERKKEHPNVVSYGQVSLGEVFFPAAYRLPCCALSQKVWVGPFVQLPLPCLPILGAETVLPWSEPWAGPEFSLGQPRLLGPYHWMRNRYSGDLGSLEMWVLNTGVLWEGLRMEGVHKAVGGARWLVLWCLLLLAWGRW